MAGTIDYARLRDQALNSTQEEDQVQVNTRALVDKILARYSGEWTTLRELIQNAADASATKVIIKFETQPSATVPTTQSTDEGEQLKHTFLHHTVRSLLVSNNGIPFSESDWARLKKIAEGNPDESKIGAFGVGFYSTFSECENPFIVSGSDSMAFYWKRDQLFTRRAALPEPSAETCFVLEYRNTTSPIPSLISICQFLSTSITFVGLEGIELWVDDWNLFTLRKKSAPSSSVALPKDVETGTKEGMMRLQSVASQTSQIDATWVNIVGWTPAAGDRSASVAASEAEGRSASSLRGFFSRLATAGASQNNAVARKAAKDEETAQRAIVEDLMGISKATVFIRINEVSVRTKVSNIFATELERATKKPAPKQTKISILTSSYDETTASLSTLTGTAAKKAADIITNILPSKGGRIFIGFPTAQTTGLLAHISAPSLIPTVEREQIDLNARYIRTWNTELLHVAGIACRIAYAGEMAVLRQKFVAQRASTSLDPSEMSALLPAAVHALKEFTFKESTPIGKVGQIIEESFWACSSNLDVPSSNGIVSSREVRVASENLSFVNRIPVVPEALFKEANEFITKLRDFAFISEITTSDIKKELEKQALTEDQLHEFLKWLAKKATQNDMDAAAIQSMLAVTIASVGDAQSQKNSSQSTLLELRSITSFVNSSRIPPDLPVPSTTMPFRFTKTIGQSEMQLFGWQELQIVPWVRWLLDRASAKGTLSEENLTDFPSFAAQILAVISKSWDAMSQSSRTTLTELLSQNTVIPTKMGMKKPGDAYFSSVKLFDDLPTITSLNNVKEKFLKALGVRKTVELTVIFERLMATSTSGAAKADVGWSHVDLIKYLVSVWNDIPSQDIAQLQNTPLCPAETNGKAKTQTKQHFKVSELFEPKDQLRELGLPILQWPGQWNPYSPDGKTLKLLGLRAYPSVPELVDVLVKAHSTNNDVLYEKGLKYFIENHYTQNYATFDLSHFQTPFLPLQNGQADQLAKPEDCFTDPRAEVFEYPILRQDLRSHAGKFGVQTDPPIADCALRLTRRPPKSRTEARRLFGYFASRVTEVSGSIVDKLSSAAIVPIAASRNDDKTVGQVPRLVTPTSVFLGDSAEYGDIFDYVDFGTEANLFLLKIGCKHEPSIVELTQLVISQPKKILKTLKVERYRNLLYKLHLNMASLKKVKTLWKEMKSASFLLAIKETTVVTTGGLDADQAEDEPKAHQEYHLRNAENIAIQDDLICYTLFKSHVFIAPQEELLEDLYFSLGSPLLSTLVDEEARFGPRSPDQQLAEVLKELILERARLFLHEQIPSTVIRDLKYLENHLEVQIVQSISLRRTLRGQNTSDVEKRSAALKVVNKSQAVLSVTAKYDVWQISQCIVSLLIDRPKTQLTMIFETFLVTPLLKLRARGYNVDRILRKRANEEARIAEADRARREAEERQRQEKDRKHQDEVNESPGQKRLMKPRGPSEQFEEDVVEQKPSTPQLPVPGAFQDTPMRPKTSRDLLQQPERPNMPRGLLSTISKHFGFDQLATTPQQLHAQNQLIPSPEASYNPHQPQGPGVEAATSPNRVMQNLQSAVTATRAYGSKKLFTRPETTFVKEMDSYCDTKPGHDLAVIGTVSSGLRVYLDSTSPAKDTFFAQNSQGLEYFASVILAAASVFQVAKESLHIYFDEAGTTIAFNVNGSIFFNYRFFAQLHLDGLQDASTRSQAVIYWWVVLCHELAHNLVADHSSGHSYWTEQFVAQYFPAVAALTVRLAEATGGVA